MHNQQPYYEISPRRTNSMDRYKRGDINTNRRSRRKRSPVLKTGNGTKPEVTDLIKEVYLEPEIPKFGIR